MSEYSHNPLKTADSPNHGNHLNGLTTRQDRAIAALLESPSIAAAARKAEVGESTLRQWPSLPANTQAGTGTAAGLSPLTRISHQLARQSA